MQKIKLNKNTDVDLAKLIDSRLLVQANSGGGKSWLLRRLLEQSHGHVQQIVIDLEGEFSTLREKYDYVLAGKGGDTPATPQSAALLAKKLLELNVSAIIDLYELNHLDRKRFVRLFLESMVNAPKELWHPVMVIIDEAHVFCPEKGQSEASDAVIDLATRGRKRGYCAVLATQRLSKLHKDAAAECNNKLIGRTGLDIDMKRAAEELGFTSKDQYLSLRALAPGEFFAFGPALTTQVEKVQVGEVQTSHLKAGSRAVTKVAPPTDKIKHILGKLADLPAEAKKEAMTLQEMKTELATAKTKIRTLEKGTPKTDPAQTKKEVDRAIALTKKEDGKILNNWIAYGNFLEAHIKQLAKNAELWLEKRPKYELLETGTKYFVPSQPVQTLQEHRELKNNRLRDLGLDTQEDEKALGAGPRKILTVIAQHEDGITRQHITIVSGYRRSSRDIYIQKLQQRSLVRAALGKLYVTDEGIAELGNDYEVLPTGNELQEKLMRELPLGEKKILEALIGVHPEALARDTISELTGYQRSSRDIYLQKLNARKLIDIEGGLIKASDKLFD